MQVTPEELATLIGLKDIEIMALQKEIKALRLAAATSPEAKAPGSELGTGRVEPQQ